MNFCWISLFLFMPFKLRFMFFFVLLLIYFVLNLAKIVLFQIIALIILKMKVKKGKNPGRESYAVKPGLGFFWG